MNKKVVLLKLLSLAMVVGGIFLALPLGAQSIWNPASGIDWSASANWLPTGVPTGASVLFEDLGIVGDVLTIDNIVDQNLAISSLQYGQTNGFHNSQINPGVTLVVSNALAANVLVAGTETDNGLIQAETNTISGAGSLTLINTNPASAIIVRQGSLNAGAHESTLDLSGLGTFNASVGLVHVGVETETNEAAGTNFDIQRPLGIWLLAQTNIIVASGGGAPPPATPPAIDIGDGHVNGGNGIMELGLTNAIFADSMSVGYLKSRTLTGAFPLTGSFLEFNPTFTNSAVPALYLRGFSTSRMPFLSVGDNDGTGGNVLTTGNLNLSGGTVNALVDTCYIGRSEATNGNATAAGTLSFYGGIVDINTLNIGYVAAPSAISKVTGNVNVHGSAATLRVNTMINLGENPGATATGVGNLNIFSGNVLANAIIGGSTNTSIVFHGGLLSITNFAGTTVAPIGLLDMEQNGTLQLNVNGGAHQTNIVTASITNADTTTIQISFLTGVATGVTYSLISYTNGVDHFTTGAFSLVLPSGYIGQLVDSPGVVGITLTTVPVTTPPRFTGIQVSGSTLTITATNGMPATRFVLLGATNLMLPFSQWTPLLTNSFDANGNLNLSTNILNAALSQQFYVISEQ